MDAVADKSEHAESAAPEANKRTVEKYMAAYGRYDHDVILSCLTDDVEWVIPGAYTRSGKAEFDAEIEAGGSVPPDIHVSRIIAEADVVVAEGTVRAPTNDGRAVNLVFCDVFEMRAARIRRLVSYLVMLQEKPGP